MENFDFDDNVDFRLTDEEGKKNIKRFAMVGLYALLAVVVMVTGAHAIMLVMAQAPAEIGAENSLLAKFLNAIRITFPIVVEAAAVVAGLGFIGAKWRKGQKTAAFMIELVWVIFAAANMITFFRIERGLALETWQVSWVDYGLPLSALVAGILTYALTRTDPDLKRKDEETAAEEKIKAIKFSSRRDVAISAQRVAIEKQRAWIDFIKNLQTRGYSTQQIRYMLQGVPELLVDGDGDGRMDLLESGDGAIPGTARQVYPQSTHGYYVQIEDMNEESGWHTVNERPFVTLDQADAEIDRHIGTRRRIVDHNGNHVLRNRETPVARPTPAPQPTRAQSNGHAPGYSFPKRDPYSPE
ncbi:MAG: hypothetical protein IT327_07615 [Anaerolineae bacterium]|nr:hypothetical protein [Anaerolineae bacterium]